MSKAFITIFVKIYNAKNANLTERLFSLKKIHTYINQITKIYTRYLKLLIDFKKNILKLVSVDNHAVKKLFVNFIKIKILGN